MRKMLGDVHSPVCRALMALIETQNRHTLAAWAIDYARTTYLPIFRDRQDDGGFVATMLAECETYLTGGRKLSEIKPILRELRQWAGSVKDPIAQAAARAIATACAAIQTPANAFGFLLYGAAATTYDRAGTNAGPDVCEALANDALQRALESLSAIAVAGEPHPVKINWHC